MGMEQLLYIHIKQSYTTALCLSGYKYTCVHLCVHCAEHICAMHEHILYLCTYVLYATVHSVSTCSTVCVCVHVEQLIWLGASLVDLTEVTSHYNVYVYICSTCMH